MRHNSRSLMTALILSLLLLPAFVAAQVTRSDYERAGKLREKFQGLAINISERANAIEATSRFWYRKSVTGGNEFVLVDADTATKKAAFDHAKLAASLSAANGQSYAAVTLPFSTITFVEKETAIEFVTGGSRWKCDLIAYACAKTAPARQGAPAALNPEANPEENPQEFGNDVFDGMVDLSPQSQQPPQGLQVPGEERPRGNQEPKVSPDGNW